MALADFVDEGVKVEAGGRTVEVRAVRVRRLQAFSKALAPALPYVGATAEDKDGILPLVMHETDKAIALVLAGTDLDEGFVGDLLPDDLARLVEAVLAVNMDFFGQRLMPVTTAATKALGTAFRGMMPSPTSATETSA